MFHNPPVCLRTLRKLQQLSSITTAELPSAHHLSLLQQQPQRHSARYVMNMATNNDTAPHEPVLEWFDENRSKVGAMSTQGMNGKLFESQMLAALNCVHEAYTVISVSEFLKNKRTSPEQEELVKYNTLHEHRREALIALQKMLAKNKSGATTPTLKGVFESIECDFAAVLKRLDDDSYATAMSGMNEYLRRVTHEATVLTLEPEETAPTTQKAPMLGPIHADNFFVKNEQSVPRKVVMEVTVTENRNDLKKKLYQLAKAAAFLDCMGGLELAPSLLMVAINSDKGDAQESVNSLFGPEQADFRELIRRALQPEATKADPVEVVLLWAPFRNIYDEIHSINTKLDDNQQQTNTRIEKLEVMLGENQREMRETQREMMSLFKVMIGVVLVVAWFR